MNLNLPYMSNYNKKNYFSNKSFDKYINSLPKYLKKRTPPEYEYYIKDYLLKNRSARLADIIRGCLEQGLKLNARDPGPMFYKNLKNLIRSGQVTKEDTIYLWNYKE